MKIVHEDCTVSNTPNTSRRGDDLPNTVVVLAFRRYAAELRSHLIHTARVDAHYPDDAPETHRTLGTCIRLAVDHGRARRMNKREALRMLADALDGVDIIIDVEQLAGHVDYAELCTLDRDAVEEDEAMERDWAEIMQTVGKRLRSARWEYALTEMDED